MFFGSLILMVLLLPLWVLCEWGIRREERDLQKRFGEQYLSYRSRVRQWL